MKLIWDDSNLRGVFDKIEGGLDGIAMQSAKDMADTLLILSRYEVPHDTGQLQITGHTEADVDGYLTIYNSVYAAFQHEGKRADGTHIIKFHQKGRKGKYLEDPLKMNMDKWREIAAKKLADFLNSGGL